MDLALDNLQGLICHKAQANNQPTSIDPGANRCFSLRCEHSCWVDSLERFRSRDSSLSSACVKGTGRWSSSGLYVLSPATTVMSLRLESKLYSMLPSGSGTERSGIYAKIAVLNVIFSFSPVHWNGILFFFFYHSSNPSSSLHTFYSKHGEQMVYDSLVWLQNNYSAFFTKSVVFLLDG